MKAVKPIVPIYNIFVLQLTPADRSNLMDDIFALAESRAVPFNMALNLTTYLLVENDLVPWQTAASIFKDLAERLHNTLAYDNLMVCMEFSLTSGELTAGRGGGGRHERGGSKSLENYMNFLN